MTKTKTKLGLGLAVVLAVAALAGVGATGVSAKTPDCTTYPMSQPFLPWLDLGSYFLMPGGSFENVAPGWTLAGGAKVVNGNESFSVGGAKDSHSLSLPPGSSAKTPFVCVSLLSPDLRLFALNPGSPLSLLRVDMTYTNLLGRQATTTVGLLAGGSRWSLSLPVLILQNVLPQVVNGQTSVSFTLAPLGKNGSWQVDDDYVYPIKNH